MRLGNSDSGAEAERIVLRFTVTNENAFFLLRYAVLLNDPAHEEHEQPRFRLSITNTNGVEYPCGRYEVAAATNLENFENCKEDWKVRLWTNIGIELLSYLGEEIIIEMMTTDCALGGHAGFAYLDATCRPLEIELFNNCSDTSTAMMQVTPGFDAYLWSSGQTSSEISIPNPVVGDIYYVTVTSATGCQLILNDTIPPYEVPQTPVFGNSSSTDYCKDTTFWFRPEGTNLQQIYSVQHQNFIDSIFINTFISNEYTFIAFSDAGCAFDTITHYFGGLPKVFDTITDPMCHNSSDGSIAINPNGIDTQFQYQWSTGSNDTILNNVNHGTYFLTISDLAGCTNIEQYVLTAPEPITTDISYDEYLCQSQYGSAFINVYGGTFPYMYSFDNGISFQDVAYYDQFIEGQNIVIVSDENECLDTFTITFDAPTVPTFEDVSITIDSCGTNNSSIQIIQVNNGQAPYQYSLNNMSYGDQNTFPNLSSGTYTISIKDANGCIGYTSVEIPSFSTIS